MKEQKCFPLVYWLFWGIEIINYKIEKPTINIKKLMDFIMSQIVILDATIDDCDGARKCQRDHDGIGLIQLGEILLQKKNCFFDLRNYGGRGKTSNEVCSYKENHSVWIRQKRLNFG